MKICGFKVVCWWSTTVWSLILIKKNLLNVDRDNYFLFSPYMYTRLSNIQADYPFYFMKVIYIPIR